MPKYNTMREEEKQKILRVFIIGNGFDIAHGIKSRYTDFIWWYLEEIVIKFINKTFNPKKEKLFTIETKGGRFVYLNEEKIKSIFKSSINLNELRQQLKNEDLDVNELNSCTEIPSILKGVFQSDDLKWSDIENNYFKSIHSFYDEMIVNNTAKYRDKVNYFIPKINLFNSQLEFFKDKFIEFLNKQDSPFSNEFDSFFKKNSNINVDWREEKFEIGLFDYDSCFLNFNYTQTAKKYIKDKDFFNIHGSLGDIRNPPIFGLGDEYHPIYREFVELNEPELLKNVKSIKYLQANVYKKLMNKLREYDNIEYIVLGHSCGMSDRTLLKELFNMEDKNIKIYLYNYQQFKYDDNGRKIEKSGDEGKEDYTNKLYGLSSYFENNQIMRDKVGNFDENLIMPQLKK